jgi:hypothetical protein
VALRWHRSYNTGVYENTLGEQTSGSQRHSSTRGADCGLGSIRTRTYQSCWPRSSATLKLGPAPCQPTPPQTRYFCCSDTAATVATCRRCCDRSAALSAVADAVTDLLPSAAADAATAAADTPSAAAAAWMMLPPRCCRLPEQARVFVNQDAHGGSAPVASSA